MSQESDTIGDVSSTLTKLMLVIIAHLLLCECLNTTAQTTVQRAGTGNLRYSLSELRDKRRALLIVFRTGIVDAGDNERAIIDVVLKTDARPRGRNQWVYGVLAKKLNAYIRKYRSLTAAQEFADADYVIFFNLLEFRRILNTTYPFGELFVIVKGDPEAQIPPHVIWKSKKVLNSGDAISDFIRELKMLRGEN